MLNYQGISHEDVWYMDQMDPNRGGGLVGGYGPNGPGGAGGPNGPGGAGGPGGPGGPGLAAAGGLHGPNDQGGNGGNGGHGGANGLLGAFGLNGPRGGITPIPAGYEYLTDANGRELTRLEKFEAYVEEEGLTDQEIDDINV